jgi:secondary thiamine-phosphate synthase enzyme
MRQHHEELRFRTDGSGLTEISSQVQDALTASGLVQGACTLFVQHTSASLTVQENADPSARRDLEAFLERLVPEGDPLYEHVAEGPDDMPAHVRSALTLTSLTIPFQRARLSLGTWQGVFLWEHRRRPHDRRVAIHLLGD